MRISKVLMAFAATTLLVTGCANKEEPATQAVASSEAALSEVRGDAAKYAPEELKSAETDLATLKDKLAKEDYKAVVAGAPKLNTEVSSLKEVVVSRQTQMVAATHEWESLSADIPKMVEAIQTRVTMLSESRSLPKNVDQETFEAAKSGLTSMKSMWAEASAAFSAGKAAEAADKARMAQAKGEELLKQLDMTAA
jgi:hypothetical protein